jgi:hypothetical protein
MLAEGDCTLVATQSGNSEYEAASASQSFCVKKFSQSVQFASVPDQTVGATVKLNATASSGLPVTFSSKTSKICSVSGSSAKMLAVGDCTLVATQPGNSEYEAASLSRSFCVNKPK